MAHALECHHAATGAFPTPKFDLGETLDLHNIVLPYVIDSVDDNVELNKTFVKTWDSYALCEFLQINNVGLLICNKTEGNTLGCCGKYIDQTINIDEYVRNLEKQYM